MALDQRSATAALGPSRTPTRACSEPRTGGLGRGPYRAVGGRRPRARSTNQRMEIQAASSAVATLAGADRDRERLHLRRELLPRPLVEGWLREGWVNSAKKPVANRDLWEPLIELVRSHGDVTFRWVKGTLGDPMNDLVDRLAVQAAVTQEDRTGEGLPRGSRSGRRLATPPASTCRDKRLPRSTGAGDRTPTRSTRRLRAQPAERCRARRIEAALRAMVEVEALTVVAAPPRGRAAGGRGGDRVRPAARRGAAVPQPRAPWPKASGVVRRGAGRRRRRRSPSSRRSPPPSSWQARRSPGETLAVARQVDAALVVWDREDDAVGRTVRPRRTTSARTRSSSSTRRAAASGASGDSDRGAPSSARVVGEAVAVLGAGRRLQRRRCVLGPDHDLVDPAHVHQRSRRPRPRSTRAPPPRSPSPVAAPRRPRGGRARHRLHPAPADADAPEHPAADLPTTTTSTTTRPHVLPGGPTFSCTRQGDQWMATMSWGWTDGVTETGSMTVSATIGGSHSMAGNRGSSVQFRVTTAPTDMSCTYTGATAASDAGGPRVSCSGPPPRCRPRCRGRSRRRRARPRPSALGLLALGGRAPEDRPGTHRRISISGTPPMRPKVTAHTSHPGSTPRPRLRRVEAEVEEVPPRATGTAPATPIVPTQLRALARGEGHGQRAHHAAEDAHEHHPADPLRARRGDLAGPA